MKVTIEYEAHASPRWLEISQSFASAYQSSSGIKPCVWHGTIVSGSVKSIGHTVLAYQRCVRMYVHIMWWLPLVVHRQGWLAFKSKHLLKTRRMHSIIGWAWARERGGPLPPQINCHWNAYLIICLCNPQLLTLSAGRAHAGVYLPSHPMSLFRQTYRRPRTGL